MDKGLRLGISKIGDLLLNNKITDSEDGFSIEKIVLKIPEYQRPYKWTAKNANQLLDDIIEAMNDNKWTAKNANQLLDDIIEAMNDSEFSTC